VLRQVRRAARMQVEVTVVVEAVVDETTHDSTTRTSDLPPPGILPHRPSSCVGLEATLLLLVQVSEADIGFGGRQWNQSPPGHGGPEGRLPWTPSTTSFCFFCFLDL
jgi:hypothetical protein